ncbi:hypothetical protein QE444_003522 [Pseudomonas sp. SORGH_AS199]|uniref:hypothetical protein n=1 Tax=Pseudomonas sp. SORGH_AS_0199 TaxID=3041761 RepID=UPI002855E75B|nr:hypothetical protein [Pseudomonas sp. SORGH_AS_0199]MDR6231165.1 hypothetical protein [Pseudomonas sp. SORGH_AS_0199]
MTALRTGYAATLDGKKKGLSNMAMSAEPDDAPDWLVQKPGRTRPIALIVSLAIGSLATFAALELASRTLPGPPTSVGTDHPALRTEAAAHLAPEAADTVRGTVRHATPSPVEGNAAAAATPPSNVQPPAASVGKQTVFNDRNFTPRGSDNVVSFSEAPRSLAPEGALPQLTKVTVVHQTPSMKDRACWPYKAGSLEHRNCRSAVGLQYRD